MSAKTEYYNTGGGELFFTPFENGVYGVEKPFGQTEDIKFSQTVESITHDNTEGATTFEDMNILKKVTGKLSIDTVEISPDMLTRAFLGTNFTTSVSAGTNVTTTVTVSAFDTDLFLGKKYLSNVVVKNSGDTVTYEEGVDYTIDFENGILRALSTGGTIAVNDVLDITFDNSAYDDIRIEAFLNSKIEGRLRFVAKSATGVSYTYTYHKVSLIASGDYSLKSSQDFAKLSFEGSMLASDLITDPNASKLFKIEGSKKTV